MPYQDLLAHVEADPCTPGIIKWFDITAHWHEPRVVTPKHLELGKSFLVRILFLKGFFDTVFEDLHELVIVFIFHYEIKFLILVCNIVYNLENI